MDLQNPLDSADYIDAAFADPTDLDPFEPLSAYGDTPSLFDYDLTDYFQGFAGAQDVPRQLDGLNDGLDDGNVARDDLPQSTRETVEVPEGPITAKRELSAADDLYAEPVADPPAKRRPSGRSATWSSADTLVDLHEYKAKDKLRRNRAAATKCRKRKNDETESLKAVGEKIQAKHVLLTANLAVLKDEVLELKNEVLKHGACDCVLITTYIENAAKALV